MAGYGPRQGEAGMRINAVRYLQPHRAMALATGVSSVAPFCTVVRGPTSGNRQTGRNSPGGEALLKVGRNKEI